MISHNKGHVDHSMLLTKTSVYNNKDMAIRYEKDLAHLHENIDSFNRIYVPRFTWDRYENEIRLEMEFVWGHQMSLTTPQRYYKIIYEDIVLNNRNYGFKDLTYHNFVVMETGSLAYVDLESYGYHTIARRRSAFLRGICRFPEGHLPRQVSF